jgi:NAD+ synthase
MTGRTAANVSVAPLADPLAVADRLSDGLREEVQRTRRRGVVVGLSGGVDSSVVAGLAARALGPDRVLGVIMPERESDPDSVPLARSAARQFGIKALVEDVTGTLDALGCYVRRDAAFASALPAFGPGWRGKLVAQPRVDGGAFQLTTLVAVGPDGRESQVRLPADAYRTALAASNYKQRVRAMVLYHHAERLHRLVAGTPNRIEFEQGFFVKHGDGAADVKPIARLLKSHVYQLADLLGVPEQIVERPPTTDTFPLPQSQGEFYFGAPFDAVDAATMALDAGEPADALAAALSVDHTTAERLLQDVQAKRRAAGFLHASAAVLEPWG